MLNILRQDKNAEFCIITPLKPGDKISRDTKISVKRNDKPFIWATYESDNNVARNFKLGFQELKKNVKMPPYTIKIDADTLWSRNTLDNMVNVLSNTSKYIAYCYCSFEYKSVINQKFPAKEFNSKSLQKMNFISSNSMFKTAILEEIELVTDDYYKRLLDYCYFLKLLNNGYIGIPCQMGYFIATVNEDSISAGGSQDFKLKYNRVKKDFIDIG